MKMNRKKMMGLAGIALFYATGVFADSNEKGIDLYRAELYNAAKIFFTQQTNQSTVEQAENNYYLGQTYYELQQVDSATYFYDQAVAIHPEYPFGYIGQGKIALSKDDKKGAENLFKKANGLAKKDPSVQTSIAEVYIAAKMYPEAEEALEKATKVNKKYSGIFVAEGDMLMQENKVGEACARYENAIVFDTTDKVAYLKLARVYKTINTAQALSRLNDLITIDPNYIPAYAEIGDINRSEGMYLKALEAYKKFISIPGVPIVQHERYAQLLYFTDSYTESLKQIQYVLKQDPKNPVMHRLEAYNNFKLENYALAVEQMSAFLDNNPENTHIYLDYLTLGQALLKEKQALPAIDAFIKASQLKDTKPEIYKELASAYKAADNYPGAVNAYDQFFAAESTPVVFDYFYYGQACYTAATKYVAADVLNAKLTPEEEAANHDALYLYIGKGNGAFDEVINRSPESYLGYLWKANLNSLPDYVEQAKTGKLLGAAKPYYEEAIKVMLAKNENGVRNADLIDAYNYLGSYYVLTEDNKTKAGEYYKAILELDPDNARVKQTLDVLKIKY
jgi:tetratricopeptide (TPR) repeat protein